MNYFEKAIPRFFITGSRGFIGQALSACFHRQGYYVFESHLFNIRFDHPSNLAQVLRRLKPDMILHLAAYRGGHDSKEKDMAIKINIDGTANLADVAENLQIPVMFASSDQVFDGRKDKAYTEKDILNPVTFFGRIKMRGEEIIRNADLPKFWILRLSPVWSEEVQKHHTYQNFLARIVRTFEGDSCVWPSTINGGLIHRTRICEAVEALYFKGNSGVYHLSSDTEKTYFEQARFMAGFLGPSKELISDAIRPSSPPPQNFRMNCEKIMKATDLIIPTFEQDVKRWLAVGS